MPLCKQYLFNKSLQCTGNQHARYFLKKSHLIGQGSLRGPGMYHMCYGDCTPLPPCTASCGVYHVTCHVLCHVIMSCYDHSQMDRVSTCPMEGPTLHCSVTYSLPSFENWELDLGNRDYVVSRRKKNQKKLLTKNCQIIEKGGMASMGLCKSKLCGTTIYKRSKGNG